MLKNPGVAVAPLTTSAKLFCWASAIMAAAAAAAAVLAVRDGAPAPGAAADGAPAAAAVAVAAPTAAAVAILPAESAVPFVGAVAHPDSATAHAMTEALTAAK